MYTRQFDEPPKKIIENGKARLGSFSPVSSHIDIKGMRSPYAGVPVPAFLSNLRIKSRLTYTFSLGSYIGFVEFRDFKVFGLSEVTFWNKETCKRSSYHSIMPARRRFVPTKTSRAICACYQKHRRIRLFWEDSHDFFKCQFNVKGDKVRPSAKGKMISVREDSQHSDVMYVNPAPTSSRISASWLSTMRIRGSLHTYTKDSVQEHKVEEGIALVSMNRAYFKFHTDTNSVTGIGQVKGKNIIFSIGTANIDAADNYRYNSNTLVADGEVTPLPPVVITHPFGISRDWIIQDTENMVDLTFSPASIQSRTVNVLVMRTVSDVIYGTFEGVLLTKDGQKIVLKNFPGIVSKSHVRT